MPGHKVVMNDFVKKVFYIYLLQFDKNIKLCTYNIVGSVINDKYINTIIFFNGPRIPRWCIYTIVLNCWELKSIVFYKAASVLQCDCAKKLYEVAVELGLHQSTSRPYASQANSLVGRATRHVEEGPRTVLARPGLPPAWAALGGDVAASSAWSTELPSHTTHDHVVKKMTHTSFQIR